MVYYVIVESETEGNPWKVPAVMFSNPYAHKETRYAELLPLSLVKCSKSVCLKPMLQRKSWRRVFRRGFFLKVQTLLKGRAFDSSRENSWNMYDIRYKVMQNVLREFIGRDISQFSLYFTNEVMPLNPINTRCEGFRKGLRRQTVQRSPGILNHEEKETTLKTSDHKPSIFRMNNEMPEVGCWRKNFQNIPKVYILQSRRKKIRNAKIRTTFSRASSNMLDELNKRCCISDII